MADRKGTPSAVPAPSPAGTKKSSAKPRADEGATIKVASNKKESSKDKQGNGVIKLKKAVAKFKHPGNWKDGAFLESDKKSSKGTPNSGPPPSPSPVVNQLDENAWETFATGRPLEDTPDLQQCKHCKKSVLRTAAKAHIAACLRIKKEKAQRKKEAREARERAKEAAREEELRKAGGVEDHDGAEEDDDDEDEPSKGGKTTKKAAGKKTESADNKGNKKRKAEAELDKGPKKKKKEEPKPKVPKPKGPVDVERQCGVILPNGQACARSLTCKSHSMGAKRAVPGRSLPYDMLLAAYQKKNQAKQQKAAIDANAPLEDEDDPNAATVDSDEETAAVMSSLTHWRPQPVVPQPIFEPIKRTYHRQRLRDQLNTATNGGRINIFKVTSYGAQKLPDGHPGLYDNEDALGEPDPLAVGPFSRRSSSFSTQRRPSVASRA